MGRNYTICKDCSNKIYKSGQVYCDQHLRRCRPFHVVCGQKIEKNHSYCSEHECTKCENKSRFDCNIHYCANKACQREKIVNSNYCDRHTCKLCSQEWPCSTHECKKKNCHLIVCPPYSYCENHSMKNNITDFETIEMMNHELDIYYELHDNDTHYYYYTDFYYFEELQKHNKEYLFEKTFERVATKINKSIKQKEDANKYGLACTSYCSEGYCTCSDLMPYINTQFYKEETAISEENEKVYILSDKARVYTDWGFGRDDVIYKTWTISKIFVDDLDYVWDKTEDQIMKMIVFETIG